MNNGEFEEMDIGLPRETMHELNARAAAQNCLPAEIIYRAFVRSFEKGPEYQRKVKETVRAIDDAMIQGQDDYPLWPKDFSERLVVGTIVGEAIRRESENYLLNLSGPEMDIVESACQEKGINYEEFVRELVDAFLDKQNAEEPNIEGQEEQDEADWWKE